jgi:hypothetical protein
MKTEQPEDENNAIPSEKDTDCSARNSHDSDLDAITPDTDNALSPGQIAKFIRDNGTHVEDANIEIEDSENYFDCSARNTSDDDRKPIDLSDKNVDLDKPLLVDPVTKKFISGGYPTRLTREKFNTIVRLSGNWSNENMMAGATGVSRATIIRWFKKGKEMVQNGATYDEKQAKKVQKWLKGESKLTLDERLVALYNECQRAKTKTYDQLTIALQAAMFGDMANGKPPDGKLILSVLERRYAEMWAQKEESAQGQTIINDASQAKINVFIPQEKPLKEVPDEGEVK